MFINPKSIALILLMCLTCAHAKTGDTLAPINISADTVQVDNHKQSAQYRGNVVFTQGSIKINAEAIDIFTAKGKLKSASINGSANNLARFEQSLDSGQIIVGKAENIVIDAVKKNIQLNRNASLDDGNNQLSGAHISYDSVRQTISANNKGNAKKRVNMTFLPASDSQ